EPVARELGTVGVDVEVVAPDYPLGICARGPRHRADDGFNLARKLLDLGEIGAEDLDTDRRTDAGREHVDARLYRHRPSVGNAGKLQRAIHFRDELVDRYARSPFALRLKV